MKQFGILVLGLWSSVSVFSQTDFFEELSLPNLTEPSSGPYDFAPDAGSPDVEVAPLEVNSKDQDVPYPQGMPETDGVPEQIIPADVLQPEEQSL